MFVFLVQFLSLVLRLHFKVFLNHHALFFSCSFLSLTLLLNSKNKTKKTGAGAGAPAEEYGENSGPKECSYNPKKVNEWSNTIVVKCLKDLYEMNKPFKYVISCIIMQKNGAGLNSSASMHWDTAKDGFCKVPWQNSTMHCIVSVFGLSINIDDPQDDMM